MAFKYLFELNGVELQDVSIGATAIEKFEEPLDEGSLRLPFTIRNYEYEMLGYLKIIIEDGNSTQKILNFLIISDEVSEGSKYGEFIHEITITEYSHKYDKYLVHSLAKTKAIKDNNPAKFLYNENIVMNFPVGLTFPSRFVQNVWIPPIEVLASYYNDENITFEQVEQGYQTTYDTLNSGTRQYARVDVYLKINGVRYNLSSNSVSILLNAGDYDFEYGFVGVANGYTIPTGDTWLYKYKVRIIDRESISVLDALNLVRDTVSRFGGIESKLYFENTRMFNIDPAIESYLESIEIPQTYIQKATLRQVLNSIFLYVNAISRLYNDEVNDIDLLSMDEFNKITGSFTMNDIAGYSSSQESNQLGSKGVSWLERLLPDNRENPNIIEPSGNQFKTVRSNNIQITQDKFGLELSKTLYEPKKFYTQLEKLRIKDTSNYDYYDYYNYKIHLTPRFINKSEWSIKEQTTDFPTIETQFVFGSNVGLRENKVANIFWQQGSKYIELSDVYGYVWQQTLIQNVIREALYEQITRTPPKPFINEDDEMLINYELEFDGYDDNGILQTNVGFATLDWRYYKFNLEYITQENSTIEVDRQDLTYLDYYSELRQNQSDKLINVELASRKSYGDLQRSGVPNRTFKKYHTDLSSIYNIGSEDEDGFVITKRKFEFHNNYIIVTYNATKDHNRLSQYIGLQQEYRWSEIPQTNQIFERIEPYRDYIFLTKPNVLLIEETTKIANDYTMKLLFGNLVNDWQNSITGGKTKVTSAYIRTKEFLEEYPDDTYKYAISNPVNSFAKKGGLVFQFGFENNQIALSAVKEEGENRYNKAIRYTDDLGNMEEMWFQLSREYDITTSDSGWTEKETNDNYPLIRTNKPTGESYATFGSTSQITFQSGPSNDSLPTYDALIIKKDKSQNIKIPYQLNVIPYDYKTYVIGQEFYNENFLVKNPKQKEYQVFGTKTLVYIYDDLTPYGIFDDLKIKSGYNTALVLFNGVNVEIDTTENTFRFLSTTLTDVLNGANWAIGDELGNLYLACNDNLEGFNFFKKHFVQDLLEIGNRTISEPPIIHFDELIIEATVIGEIVTVTGIMQDIEGYVYSDSLPILGQDEYEETHAISSVSGEITYVLGEQLSLEGVITSSSNVILGQDEYEETIVVSNITAETEQYTGVIYSIEGDIYGEVIPDIGQDEYGETIVNSNIIAEISFVLGEQQSLEGVISSDVSTIIGQDEYEETILIASITAQTEQVTGVVYELDGFINSDIATIGQDEYGVTTVTGNIYGNIIQLTGSVYILEATINSSTIVKVLDYQWFPVSGQEPTVNQTCELSYDELNVRCDSSCAFVETNGYLSTIDRTTNINATCEEGASKTVCALIAENNFLCTKYDAEITYSNCEICVAVEVEE